MMLILLSTKLLCFILLTLGISLDLTITSTILNASSYLVKLVVNLMKFYTIQ